MLIKSLSPPPLSRYQRPTQSQSSSRKNMTTVTSTSNSVLTSSKYQLPRYPEEQALHQVKPVPLLASASSMISGTTSQLTAGGTLSGIQRYEMTVINRNRDSSLGKIMSYSKVYSQSKKHTFCFQIQRQHSLQM